MIKTTIEDCSYPRLVQKAREAAEKAYCPYSGYSVGAAVLAESGNIYTGCNVENGSYGATICAERTAILKAVSEGERRISALAISSEEGSDPPFPCGMCRQVMTEFCSADTPVIVYDGDKSVFNFTLEELMPYGFKFDKK